jgi:peptidoglycan/xylan/chitin deacetylase (PgdA/CDA1 family)
MSRALILMYHAVDRPRSAQEARFCVPPAEFARQMRWLAASEYRTVTLESIADCIAAHRPLPDNAVAVTFDDGFADFREHALPVLQEHGLRATMFAVAGFLGGTNQWMQSRGFPVRSILSAEALREIVAAGVDVGSHTINHPRMTELSRDEAAREARESRQRLEDLLGAPVRHFAYPYGLYDDAVREVVEAAGYRAACSTRPGFNRADEDRLALRRIDVFGTDALWQFKQKLRFGTNHATRMQPVRYYAGRVAARIRS